MSQALDNKLKQMASTKLLLNNINQYCIKYRDCQMIFWCTMSEIIATVIKDWIKNESSIPAS